MEVNERYPLLCRVLRHHVWRQGVPSGTPWRPCCSRCEHIDPTPGPRLKVVGWGPFPWPGEKKRQAKAYAEAKRMMEIVEEVEKRSRDT